MFTVAGKTGISLDLLGLTDFFLLTASSDFCYFKNRDESGEPNMLRNFEER